MASTTFALAQRRKPSYFLTRPIRRHPATPAAGPAPAITPYARPTGPLHHRDVLLPKWGRCSSPNGGMFRDARDLSRLPSRNEST
jgi:hypothetical protein